MRTQTTKNLIQRLAEHEAWASERVFLAPSLPGAKLRVRVAGMIRTYRPRPSTYEGWARFRPTDAATAELVEEARLPEIARYLGMLRPIRARLALALRGQTWLAYPLNESDWRQRVGRPRPIAVHLVDDGGQFEVAALRWDGAAFWFEELDGRADPLEANAMRRALRDVVLPDSLQRKGLTPEAKTAYAIAAQHAPGFEALRERKVHEARDRSEAGRLEHALRTGGGSLISHTDRGEHWLVEWTDRDGNEHTSAIGKEDLTVLSSGICLSEQDSDFDLSSLVGVMQGWRDW
jgi:hypothetical protein